MRDTTVERRRALFDEALSMMRLYYADDNLSLGSVARSIATSRRQLQRVFGEHATSFRAELQRIRMSRAAELLGEGRYPVSAVARAVGYRQPAQFSKAFRRHFGRAPSELRQTPDSLAA
jgi:AraC family transcriptional regulator, regulatory protein of adaptative response / methylphosphotriester-DNA alkyltransferase methyltransferase